MGVILGIHAYNQNDITEDAQLLMESVQEYRVDAIGSWQRDSIALVCGERRLLADECYSPMPYWDEESEIVITADVILDNREELFDRLGIANERRSSLSDCELIIRAYKRWGYDCPRYLYGDFAFMIWDQRERTLFGARDLVGTRTLYFHHDAGRVAFATTMKPLLMMKGITKRIRESWLAEFITIPLVLDCVDTRGTVYQDIEQLPPAHRLLVKDGRVTVSKYGSLEPEQKLKLKSNAEYEEAFRDVFSQAVKSRLRTNQPIGATLSGGLDSGSVVSIASRELAIANKPLHTYSYIPPQDFVPWTKRTRLPDERPYIKETVRNAGNIADHYLDFDGKSSLTEMNEWLDIMEMPYKFIENSFWFKGIKEVAADQGVALMLMGSGGNFSISWGDASDYYIHLLKRLKLLKFNQELKQYAHNIGVGRKWMLRFLGEKVFARGSAGAVNDAYQFINPAFAKSTNVYECLKPYEVGIGGFSLTIANERQKFYENAAIVGMQGTVATKLSLRYGVIERDPTNDPRVIRFCLSLPLNQFVQNGMDRALVRRSMNGLLPDAVRLNQRTRGVQGSDWVHRILPQWNSFAAEIDELCSNGLVSQYLNIDRVRAAFVKVNQQPRAELANDPAMKIVIRSLVLYRFLKRLAS
ncbi:asparagine synthetase B [Paenibacillus sp. MWE-103]|uniref:asparagine synthase (glutamine-hydrolyzing) n=1 Tax=Paenibacillus artemisiicola TaxID=1172618 RepID=A0ABS3WHM0_9BACL|nr:asparagine synthase-related protein [Paenibacillus artemisiicola]MBO7747800.1 asparagine synthetase B [Paenibacillus artemisiicola]